MRDEAAHKGDREADDLGARRRRDAEGVKPRKELGQHFLIDENILGVIGRLAELEAQIEANAVAAFGLPKP